MSAKRILTVSCVLLAIVCDRLLKWLSFAALPREGAVLVYGARYELFLNTGLVFSLFNNLAAIIATLVAVIFLALWLFWKLRRDPLWLSSPTNFLGVALIAAGGVSNLFDRIYYGGVVDYLILFSRSAINLADIMILAGVLLLVLKPGSKGGHPASAE